MKNTKIMNLKFTIPLVILKGKHQRISVSVNLEAFFKN